MNKLFLSLALASTLAACGTTGITNPQLANQPIPVNQARLVVKRSSSLLYMGAPANVTLDGTRIGQLGRGGTALQNMEPGRHHLEVSTWSTPGNFNLVFDAEKGNTYGFEVAPSSSNYGNQAMWGLAGETINAQVNENTGPFQLAPFTLGEVK